MRVLNIEIGTSLLSTNQLSLQLPTATFDVMPYKSYTLQVAAETVAGRGPYSMDVDVQTPEDSTCNSEPGPSKLPLGTMQALIVSGNDSVSLGSPLSYPLGPCSQTGFNCFRK